MKLLSLASVAGAAAIIVLSTLGARADDSGLASMHDLRRERGRLCMVDHFHYGSSAGQPSKKAAVSEAVSSWQSFTDLEYGSDWARFRRAASKEIKCKVSGSGWGCEVSARPCR